MATVWSTLSRLERSLVVVAICVLLLTCVISSGLLPRRSWASMTAGFFMLSAIIVEPLLLSWFIAQRIARRIKWERQAWIVLMLGIAGALPAVVIGMRLLRDNFSW
jgi:hypothetical protein